MTIITAAEVREGDKIKVTLPSYDRMVTYEGIADHPEKVNGSLRWRTAGDSALWTDLSASVIELLDRPKPKIVLPRGIGAVVEYQRFGHDAGYGGRRVATQLKNGDWRIYGKSWATGGLRECDYNNRQTHKEFTELLNDDSRTSDFKVLFEGVAK